MSKPGLLVCGAALALSAGAVANAAEMVPWRQHAAPFSFVFGNEIDGHQQTRLQAQDGALSGFFYVRYTGAVTLDGYAVATHVNCNQYIDCSVGWTLAGRPTAAAFLYAPMHDHAIYLMNRADIAQPGSYSHFHPVDPAVPMPPGANGYLLELTAVNRFCFVHHGAESALASATCRDNGGIAIERGTDIASHLNIVTSVPPPGM
jgi:hypothetical protein